MKLELYYHPFSPFAQKLWMWALETDLARQIHLHKVVVAPVPYPGWSDNNDEVGEWNPIAKIPTLVVDLEDGSDRFSVHDSKIICDFLASLKTDGHSSPTTGKVDAMNWKRQSLQRAVDGMMDCEVLVVYEERIRKEAGLYYEKWVGGMRTKIERGFDLMEKAVADGTLRPRDGNASVGRVGAEECTAAAALGFFDARGLSWRNGRDGLSKWFDGWSKRSSFLQSRQTVDWRPNARKADANL